MPLHRVIEHKRTLRCGKLRDLFEGMCKHIERQIIGHAEDTEKCFPVRIKARFEQLIRHALALKINRHKMHIFRYIPFELPDTLALVPLRIGMVDLENLNIGIRIPE